MNWPVYMLGELASKEPNSFVDGPFGSDLKTTEYVDEGVPLIRIQNVKPGFFLPKDIKYITPAKAQELKRHNYRPGDVVITKLGNPGTACIVPPDAQPGIIVADIVRFRGQKEKIDYSYLVHFLNSASSKGQIGQYAKGSTRTRINLTSIKSIEIPLPPLPEQQRIAAILDAADALRARRRAALGKLDALLQAVFLEMFGDPVRNEKGWEEVELAELADITSGVTKGQRFNGKPTVFVPYMRVANVQDGHIVLDEVKTIEALASDAAKYKLQVGDILLTEGGDPDKLGRGAIWQGEIPNCIHQNHIFRVRLTTDQIIPQYLSALIGSQRGKRYFLKAAKQTTGIATINKSQLSRFPTLLPPRKLQVKFREIIAQIEVAKECQLRAGRGQQELFDSIQQLAFSVEL